MQWRVSYHVLYNEESRTVQYTGFIFVKNSSMGQLIHSIKNQWVNLKINGSSVAVTKTIKGKAQTGIIYIQSIIHNENKIDFFFIMCSSFVYPAKCVQACACVCVCLCVCVCV